MATARFADFLMEELRAHGMPLRFTFTPHPLVGMPLSKLRRYVEGNDPVTGRPIMEEIVAALTEPIMAQIEIHPAGSEQPRLLCPDTEDNLRRLFDGNGWTDGLPIILPTEERVAEMLSGTGHPPDEVVGEMTITTKKERGMEYTVEKVAINAVMAGARPEHLPVILAIAATGEPAFPSSTTSFGRMILVNGPIRNELGMNSGVGALSPMNLANSVIGRAWTLMTINLGNTKVGETFLGSQGNNLNYNNMCVAENEEKSVWEPFHVQKGFEPDESVVSLFRGWSFINSMGAPNRRGAHEETAIMLQAFSALRSVATLIMDPLVAKGLKENHGFEKKNDLSRWLSENVKIPAGQYWGADIVCAFMLPLARQGIEPYASWSQLPDDELIAPYNDPRNINVVIVGGETNPLWLTTDFGHTVSASIDKWRTKTAIRPSCDVRPSFFPVPVSSESEAGCDCPQMMGENRTEKCETEK
ncbi:MAG TPA: UGSC family (seleno)protein [Blastocatellia bacterium]|nr:UGSC family (seleno)protein [Blastocatellia bacterium]